MKKSPNEDPVAAVERARAELEKAESQRAALDVQRGDIDDVLTRRRELKERVELCRERLELAQARADAAADEAIEQEITELQEMAAAAEGALEVERERVDDELHKIFLGDWLDGCGRFASCQPQGRGLVEFSSGVSELVEQREGLLNRIARLQGRLVEKKAERDRAVAAARVESRRRLLAGETVKIALTPWRLFPLEGNTSYVAHGLSGRKIPCAIPPNDDRQVHVLLPGDSRPGAWMDAECLLHAEPMDPDDLTPTMAEIWKRSR